MKKLLMGMVLIVFVFTIVGCLGNIPPQYDEYEIVEEDCNEFFFDIETAAEYMRALYDHDPNLIVQYQKLSNDNFIMFARVELTIYPDDDEDIGDLRVGAAAYTTINAMLVINGRIADWLIDIDTGEANADFWNDLHQ